MEEHQYAVPPSPSHDENNADESKGKIIYHDHSYSINTRPKQLPPRTLSKPSCNGCCQAYITKSFCNIGIQCAWIPGNGYRPYICQFNSSTQTPTETKPTLEDKKCQTMPIMIKLNSSTHKALFSEVKDIACQTDHSDWSIDKIQIVDKLDHLLSSQKDGSVKMNMIETIHSVIEALANLDGSDFESSLVIKEEPL